MATRIRLEEPGDRLAIRDLHRRAFGQDDEGVLVDALRAGGYGRISLVADDDGRVVGHILFSDLPIVTPNGLVAALALAPVAVIPDQQRRGVGSRLVSDGLKACVDQGHRTVVVVGDPDFYARFGFSATLALPLRSPYAGPAFQALELVPGALGGVEGEVRYAPPFEGLA